MKTQHSNKGYVLAFEGIDGSGKSSMAALLYGRLLARGVNVALPAGHHHELGYAYWTGLVGAYFHGLGQALISALCEHYDVVIIENWCFKFAAKMALKGYDAQSLRQMLPLDACLDAVFLVDTPPEQIWQRKERFSFVELGGQDGYERLGRESFIDCQTRVRSRLLEFAGENWTRVENAAGGLDAACEQVEAELLPRLALLEGRPARD